MISLIVALARNHCIGIKNDLPWHIPADLKRFKSLTLGKPVIMGRKTFESIFARLKKPLPDRPNIVISNSGFKADGVTIVTSLNAAIAFASENFRDQEIMIIGGASVYDQAIDQVDRMYLTLIDRDVEGDAFFPRYNPANWTETERIDVKDHDPPYAFVTLERT
jgi:dihydrofolate reductase